MRAVDLVNAARVDGEDLVLERGVDLARGPRSEIDEPLDGEVDVHLHGAVDGGHEEVDEAVPIHSAMSSPVAAFDSGVGKTLAPRVKGLPCRRWPCPRSGGRRP